MIVVLVCVYLGSSRERQLEVCLLSQPLESNSKYNVCTSNYDQKRSEQKDRSSEKRKRKPPTTPHVPDLLFNPITHAALSILKRRPDATRIILNSYLPRAHILTKWRRADILLLDSGNLLSTCLDKTGKRGKKKEGILTTTKRKKKKKGSSMEPKPSSPVR